MTRVAGPARRNEELVPAVVEVTPHLGVDDERPVGGDGGDEAEDQVVHLAAEAASLAEVAQEQTTLGAVERVLHKI